MDKKEFRKCLTEIAEDKLKQLDGELVELEIKRHNESLNLVFYVYKKGGVSIDDCVNISRAIEAEIDSRDLIESNYFLEVSSPGLDRPIKTDDDLRRNIENEVEIKLYAPLNGEKNYEGRIISYDDENIEIDLGEESILLPRNKIAMMRQLIKF